MRRRARADASRIQRVPLASGPQHEDDRVHRVAIGNPRIVTSERMLRPSRQYRLDLAPELVGDPPSVIFCDQSHVRRMQRALHHGKVFCIDSSGMDLHGVDGPTRQLR